MDQPPDKPLDLNYATPVPSGVSIGTIVAFIFGSIAALFSPLFLFVGVEFVIGIARDWHRADDHDVTACIMFLAIGSLCGYVAVRWLSGALRSLRRTNGR